jgi:hypothetical protein
VSGSLINALNPLHWLPSLVGHSHTCSKSFLCQRS